MEQLDYNRLYTWFVGLLQGDPVWTSFTKNRSAAGRKVFTKLMNKNYPQIKWRFSDEHFRSTDFD
jgi:hypothetical protein